MRICCAAAWDRSAVAASAAPSLRDASGRSPAPARSVSAAASNTTACACDLALENVPGLWRIFIHRRSQRSNRLSPPLASHHARTDFAMAVSLAGITPSAALAVSDASMDIADASTEKRNASTSSSASASSSAVGRQFSRRDTKELSPLSVAMAPPSRRSPSHTENKDLSADASDRGSFARISFASPRHSYSESSMLASVSSGFSAPSLAGMSMDSASMGCRTAAAVTSAAAARNPSGSPRAACGLSALTIAARTSIFASPSPFFPTSVSLYGKAKAEWAPDAGASDGSAHASGGSTGAAAHSAASAGSASGRKVASNGYAAYDATAAASGELPPGPSTRSAWVRGPGSSGEGEFFSLATSANTDISGGSIPSVAATASSAAPTSAAWTSCMRRSVSASIVSGASVAAAAAASEETKPATAARRDPLAGPGRGASAAAMTRTSAACMAHRSALRRYLHMPCCTRTSWKTCCRIGVIIGAAPAPAQSSFAVSPSSASVTGYSPVVHSAGRTDLSNIARPMAGPGACIDASAPRAIPVSA